ncbi:MAG: ubiquinol-cytochrome c reductase iron-sulfur subunit [Acidimicrobiales bacterium]
MSELHNRRQFLTRAWQAGGLLMTAAFGWTTWDLLRPLPTSGFGGLVRSVKPDAVTETEVVEVPAARAYLTRVNGEVVALSETCTHLGCRVPYCDSSGHFECPCHGSVFDRAGDYVAGPAPRGMDHYPVEEGEDGLLYINTGAKEDGTKPGTVTIDQTPKGPMCAGEGGH